MERRLLELSVENFRSLRRVKIPLGPLNVLVGPNGVGKTNVLDVFGFLADIIRYDIEPALNARGGFSATAFRGMEGTPSHIRINLKATWTRNSSHNAPDEYELRITQRSKGESVSLSRRESFRFKRTQGRGRRITISGQRAQVVDVKQETKEETRHSIGLRRLSSGLSVLPRLTDESGGTEVAALAERLASFRVFDVNVSAACNPTRYPVAMNHLSLADGAFTLAPDASNLAAFLLWLREEEEEAWGQLEEDAREVLPQLNRIDFDFPSGAGCEVVIVLHEKGLNGPIQLIDASYGTIRLLGLLALLYDPYPPALTCIEEIDHGLHPQALELLVERLRDASERTQFLIATYSPALADRLKPHELIVCQRDEQGASQVPALSTRQIEEIVEASEGLPLGELWFSGSLGGDL